MAAYIHDMTQTLRRKSVIKIPHFNTRFAPERVKTIHTGHDTRKYEGWNFNSGNYLFTTDTK